MPTWDKIVVTILHYFPSLETMVKKTDKDSTIEQVKVSETNALEI